MVLLFSGDPVMRKLFLIALAVAFCGMLFASTAKATSLDFGGNVQLKGTGIGAVNTILTIQQDPAEWGSVGVDSSGNDVIDTSGGVKTGNSQTKTLGIGD